MAGIPRFEPENVPKEGAVRFGIFTVNDDMSTGYHPHLLHSASPTKEKHRSKDRPLQKTPKMITQRRRARGDSAEKKRRNKTSLPQPSVCRALPTVPTRCSSSAPPSSPHKS